MGGIERAAASEQQTGGEPRSGRGGEEPFKAENEVRSS